MNLKQRTPPTTSGWAPRLVAAMLLQAVLGLHAPAVLAQTTAIAESGPTTPGAPIRLRQPMQTDTAVKSDAPRAKEPMAGARTSPQAVVPAADKPTDFEAYVRKLSGAADVQRFGSDLATSLQSSDDAVDYSPLVPPDYLLRAGDELVLTLWGSVDADLRLQVDRSGRISIPRVGPVLVSGVRYGDLPDVIGRRVGQVFKNFQLSVTLGQLRGLRVYVTGFASRPGATVVSSLSTLTQALLRAGGPSAAGSLRNIQLRRGKAVVAQFDLYDLLLKGDRTADQLLQADDVIHVGQVGNQVALIGSVNRPGIFEIKAGESVADLLNMAGGFNAVADNRRLALARMSNGNDNRLTQLDLPVAGRTELSNGDVLRALNAGDVARATGQQNKRVRIEGEVVNAGEYVLPPSSSLGDVLRAAGGITAAAYLYAAEFTRESVRITQQQNYDRALRDFETQVTSAAATRRSTTSEEAAALASATAANSRLIEQLRVLKPTGRIVMQIQPTGDALPDLALEDGDRLYVPARPTIVGVFGSVFSTGSYLYSANRTVGDYLRLAGGPTRGADEASVFVIRANGAVSSSLQASSYFSRGNQIAGLVADPGDTIFVPEEQNKTTWIQNTKDWTQILYQLGIGIAGIKSAVR